MNVSSAGQESTSNFSRGLRCGQHVTILSGQFMTNTLFTLKGSAVCRDKPSIPKRSAVIWLGAIALPIFLYFRLQFELYYRVHGAMQYFAHPMYTMGSRHTLPVDERSIWL